jgi:hypothetical protein
LFDLLPKALRLIRRQSFPALPRGEPDRALGNALGSSTATNVRRASAENPSAEKPGILHERVEN